MRAPAGSLWGSELCRRGTWCGGTQTAPAARPTTRAMKTRLPVTPPPTRKDPKTDFTAEGAPPPGRVATTAPVGNLPAPPRKRLTLPRRP